MVYQIHSTMSESHASAPYSSRHCTRFSFENVFSRQKISPTMPISGCDRSRRTASLRKRSRLRTMRIAQRLQLRRRARRPSLRACGTGRPAIPRRPLRIAAPLLVGPVISSSFCSRSAHSSARQPVRTNGFGQIAEPVVRVLAGGREDLDVARTRWRPESAAGTARTARSGTDPAPSA